MKDFLLDQNDDLLIKNGDFVTGDSTDKHQEHILIAHKGEFKEFPAIGVGISDYLLEDNLKDAIKEIKRQFEYEGIKINKIEVANGEINIDASY
ncbi:oxidase [Aquimarina sp. TRL1]|uniref:oxidase n=1 Tax=Aquimarina sp. (strain TRL1) TaxID=2736252 RepID=UPI00158A091A|nr:oxidase [Aquimarina sp. TRL1]QKX04878.1 oxidase [Aquimarina sp. TRL1]